MMQCCNPCYNGYGVHRVIHKPLLYCALQRYFDVKNEVIVDCQYVNEPFLNSKSRANTCYFPRQSYKLFYISTIFVE